MPELTKALLASQRATALARKKAMAEILERAEILSAKDWAQILDNLFIIGKPVPDFYKFKDKIRLLIERYNIRPLELANPLPPRWINGGMLADFQHVHLDNKTYLLNDEQFKALDKDFAKEFQISLRSASEIKFEI